jgi:hypothetical protein
LLCVNARRRHSFDENGITDQSAGIRRPTSCFIHIAAPRKKVKQPTFDTIRTQDRADHRV